MDDNVQFWDTYIKVFGKFNNCYETKTGKFSLEVVNTCMLNLPLDIKKTHQY